MAGLRQAFFVASTVRYFSLMLSFGLTFAVSRLLTPAEVGAAMIGSSTVLVALCLREFFNPAYLVQKQELGTSDVSSLAVIQIVVSLAIAGAIYGIAPTIANFFVTPQLVTYFSIVAVAVVVEAIILPGQSLMQRDMNFNDLMRVTIGISIANTVVSIGLAACGFGFVSLAWGSLAGTVAGLAICCWLLPPRWLLTPTLRDLPEVAVFGRYQGVSCFLVRSHDAILSFALGRSLPLGDVGLFSRATLLAQLPEKVFLDTAVSVALPSFCSHVRSSEQSLARPYLHWLGISSAVHWPVLIILVLLAHPIVAVLFGPQWAPAAPLVQIIALSAFFTTPSFLAWPALVAAGAVRERLYTNAVMLPISALIFVASVQFGLLPAALSLLIIMPIRLAIELHFVRLRIPFSWPELATALRTSAVVTVTTAIGPCVILAIAGFHFNVSVMLGCVSAITAVLGWLVGLQLSGHPLWREILDIAGPVADRARTAMQNKLRNRYS